MAKKKAVEAAASDEAAATPEKVDTSFEVDGVTYDFNKKQFHLPGEGVVDVEALVVADPEKFDAVCAKLFEIKSGLINVIE